MEDRHERQSGQVGQGGTDGWQVPRHAGMPKRPTSSGAIVARTLVLVFGVLPLLIVGGIMAYCSLRYCDSPIREPLAVSLFLSDPTANEDDLRMFDVLRPAIEDHLAKAQEDGAVDEGVDASDIRASIKNGRWEGVHSNVSEPHRSPLLWVRICEMATRNIEEDSDGKWEVIDFKYPGRMAALAKGKTIGYSDRDSVIVRLRCTSGSDEGLVIENRYHRWSSVPHFENDYAECSEMYARMPRDIESIRGAIPDHRFVCQCEKERDGGDEDVHYAVFVWDDEDGSLADATKLAAMAQGVFEAVPDVRSVSVVGSDCEVRCSVNDYFLDDDGDSGITDIQGLQEACRCYMVLCEVIPDYEEQIASVSGDAFDDGRIETGEVSVG